MRRTPPPRQRRADARSASPPRRRREPCLPAAPRGSRGAPGSARCPGQPGPPPPGSRWYRRSASAAEPLGQHLLVLRRTPASCRAPETREAEPARGRKPLGEDLPSKLLRRDASRRGRVADTLRQLVRELDRDPRHCDQPNERRRRSPEIAPLPAHLRPRVPIAESCRHLPALRSGPPPARVDGRKGPPAADDRLLVRDHVRLLRVRRTGTRSPSGRKPVGKNASARRSKRRRGVSPNRWLGRRGRPRRGSSRRVCAAGSTRGRWRSSC